MASTYQTLGNIYDDVRSLANKDSTTLTDATLLPIANKYYGLMVRELIGLNEDLYGEIATIDLVDGTYIYALASDDTSSTFGGGVIKIERVEITYDSTNFRVMRPIELSDIPLPITVNNLNLIYSTISPVYFYREASLYIAPVPSSNITAGITYYFTERPDELTSSASIPDMPKDFLSVLSEGMLYDVYRKFGRTSDARDALNNWHIGLAKMKELEQNIITDKPLVMKTLPKRYD